MLETAALRASVSSRLELQLAISDSENHKSANVSANTASVPGGEARRMECIGVLRWSLLCTDDLHTLVF